MEHKGWKIVRKLGEGGQGEVSLVLSPERSGEQNRAIQQILAALEKSSTYNQDLSERHEFAGRLAEALHLYSRDASPNDLGALKQYKIPTGDDGKQAHERFAREVEVLRSVSHPSVLRLIEADVDAAWMITQFYEGRTLHDNKDQFKARPLEALKAFRGLVEGVAKLHEAKAVHRDIKPPNIFVDLGRLILGDFGIVFVEQGRERRVTETFEKVGTRDWMPPWAHTGTRVDDVKPSFDVFCLGKVLWAMLSGMEMLPFWYYFKPSFDLETLFPGVAAMKLVNERILAASIVEDEHQCLTNAGVMLDRVDEVLDTVQRDRQQVGPEMRCQFCPNGRYTFLYEKVGEPLRVLLLPPRPKDDNPLLDQQITNSRNSISVHAYRCNACGNVAMFHFPEGSPMPAWERSVRPSR